MKEKLQFLFALLIFSFAVGYCPAQEKKASGQAQPDEKKTEDRIEVNGLFLTPDGKTLIKSKRNYIRTVEIPDQVKSIRGGAFQSCTQLQQIEIPDSVEEIGIAAFVGCFNLEEVKLPKNLKIVSAYLFNNCQNLREITLPDSVEEIGEGAFWYSGLQQITIPRSVKKIGGKALLGIEEVILDPEQKNFVLDEHGVLIDQKQKILVLAPLTLAGTYEVPEGIETIGNGAFYRCSRLNKIVLPESVKTIEPDAFNKCRGLYEVVFSDGLKKIDFQAFAYCRELTVITLPDTVEEIQKKAFSSCINLSEIRISNSMQLVHKDAFYNCKNLHHVIVPQAISYKKLSEWRIPGKKVSRPKN